MRTCLLRRNAARAMHKGMGDTKWILEALEARQRSQAELARALGINPSGVNRLLKGERVLKAAEVPVIERFLGVKAPETARGLSDALRVYGGRDGQENWAPLYASGAATDGVTIIYTGDNPVSEEAKPPRHARVRGLWAFAAVGDAMAPRFEPGETVWINPHRQPRIGDDVLLIENREAGGAIYCLLRKLLRDGPKTWTVRQHTPAKEMTLSKDDYRIALVLPRE